MPTTIEHWPVEKLISYDPDPRTHAGDQIEQIEQIVHSVGEFGFTNPVGSMPGHPGTARPAAWPGTAPKILFAAQDQTVPDVRGVDAKGYDWVYGRFISPKDRLPDNEAVWHTSARECRHLSRHLDYYE